MSRPGALAALAFVAPLVLVFRCSSPPAPSGPPQASPPPPPVAGAETQTQRTGYVNASTLNVREAASADASVVAQVRRGDALSVVREQGSWVNVRLASGETGWVASRFVSSTPVSASRGRGSGPARARTAGACNADYSFTQPPALSFSEGGAHGIVVVEANVNASGTVTSTKVISNTTEDNDLALVAQREIRAAKFSPPMRDCVARSFVFTYRRTF